MTLDFYVRKNTTNNAKNTTLGGGVLYSGRFCVKREKYLSVVWRVYSIVALV